MALNMFDAGTARLDSYAAVDRERVLNAVIELYDFVLGSLLSAEMTQKQSVIFRYLTRLMMVIPNATIHTLLDLLQEDATEVFAEDIAKLTGTARQFFDREYDSREYKETKKQVLRRLWGILENQTFERMFAHPRNRLDLFEEMNAGKVILISTAKELLKEERSELFGRFFIALINQAAQERAVLPRSQRLPCYVYVDEAADYFDRNTATILEQARKYNVGMVIAHQFVGQLEAKRLGATVAANTAIKFAGGVSSQDAAQLGRAMRSEPEFILNQPLGSFAVSVRGVTNRPVSLSIALGYMEKMPRMDGEAWAEQRKRMRERYANPASEIAALTGGAPEPGSIPPDKGSPQGDGLEVNDSGQQIETDLMEQEDIEPSANSNASGSDHRPPDGEEVASGATAGEFPASDRL